ncbi:MAG: NAD-dependent protein deacetylase, family [Verrucomicrobiota bacterium]|jgi:NAD-dependent SIR2 family protein deacetylase
MTLIESARKALAEADALLITAGAGMSVDSGLPDFRGNEGFWRNYPPFAKLGLSFETVTNPRWFAEDSALAWGFYGHRLDLYGNTKPHHGHQLLLEAANRMPAGYFVVTSNVDGQFEKAGFDSSRIYEIHGSIHFLQCTTPCHQELWSAEGLHVDFNPKTFRATSNLPICPRCHEICRPNILMFADWDWLSNRAYEQKCGFESWLDSIRARRLVVIECGAGTTIPSIRSISCQVAKRTSGTLIRINPRDFDVPSNQIAMPMGALDGISQLLL